jgi:DNA-directed RNA polymerase subunit RPC12/RpoP
METLPSGTPLNPKAENNRMNIDISSRKPGENLLYTGPHLCVTCASENRTVNLFLKAGEKAPECQYCGTRALWEP